MSTDTVEPSSSRRNVLLVILSVVLVSAAGYLAWSRSGTQLAQPDTQDSAAPYICSACAHAFQLTPAGYSRLSKEGGIQRGGEDGRGGLSLRCPKCGKFEAGPALQCPKDQTPFPLTGKNGAASKCPKCGWMP